MNSFFSPLLVSLLAKRPKGIMIFIANGLNISLALGMVLLRLLLLFVIFRRRDSCLDSAALVAQAQLAFVISLTALRV